MSNNLVGPERALSGPNSLWMRQSTLKGKVIPPPQFYSQNVNIYDSAFRTPTPPYLSQISDKGGGGSGE